MVTRAIPTGEPNTLTRGDSSTWYVSDTEYPPADSWVMVYYLVSPNSTRVSWTGFTNNGDGSWLVTLVKADTQNLKAGLWNWQRVATKAAEQVTRDSGSITVLEGFASAGATASPFVDGRTFARQALDEVESAILSRASSGQTSMSFNGRSVSWSSMAELYQLRSDLRAEVKGEELGANAGLGRQIRVRYGAA